jgi:predicted phosphoribosyltransferase
VFQDRRHAGQELAAQLPGLAHECPIVLALPRGGVPPPSAAESSRELHVEGG